MKGTMPSNWALIAGGGRDEAGAQPDADALQLLRQRHAETVILSHHFYHYLYLTQRNVM
jgi:hypothetical protein